MSGFIHPLPHTLFWRAKGQLYNDIINQQHAAKFVLLILLSLLYMFRATVSPIFRSIFLCWILPWRCPKKAETCRSITTYVYIIVSNYSASVGLCVLTCLTARNLDNFTTVTYHASNTQLQHWQYPVISHSLFTVALYNLCRKRRHQ
jgi:hypothetical protein